MAWVEPSARVMVPSLPVTPGPAVTGPFTGGQYAAHEPLQTDLAGVSEANEYKVKPRALVTTLVPPIVVAFRAVLEAAAGEAAALDEVLGVLAVLLVPDGDEVPHAAAIRATPARPAGTNHRLRITYPRLLKSGLSIPSAYPGAGPFTAPGLFRELRAGLNRPVRTYLPVGTGRGELRAGHLISRHDAVRLS